VAAPEDARAESMVHLSPNITIPSLYSPLPPLPSDEQQHNQHPEQALSSNEIQDAVIEQAPPEDPTPHYTAQLTLNFLATSLPYTRAVSMALACKCFHFIFLNNLLVTCVTLV